MFDIIRVSTRESQASQRELQALHSWTSCQIRTRFDEGYLNFPLDGWKWRTYMALQLIEDVKVECKKYGTIHGLAVPRPPAHVRLQPGRVYVRYILALLDSPGGATSGIIGDNPVSNTGVKSIQLSLNKWVMSYQTIHAKCMRSGATEPFAMECTLNSRIYANKPIFNLGQVFR